MQLINPAIFKQASKAHPRQGHLFVEHLTNIDFSTLTDSGQLTGQSWAVDLALTGELNDRGMLIDFGDIKKAIKADVESLWDHKLLIPSLRQDLNIYNQGHLSWPAPCGGQYIHKGPQISVYEMALERITISAMEEHLQDWLTSKWQSAQIQQVQVFFREETGDHGFFHYSHGLRLHEGACQRIAHGHRSKVRVFSKRGLELDLSKALANTLDHRYFVDEHTIIKTTDSHITLAYTAPEGFFELQIPRAQAIITKAETTIEHIAKHLLDHFTQESATAVQAYEGWKKGAFAVR